MPTDFLEPSAKRKSGVPCLKDTKNFKRLLAEYSVKLHMGHACEAGPVPGVHLFMTAVSGSSWDLFSGWMDMLAYTKRKQGMFNTPGSSSQPVRREEQGVVEKNSSLFIPSVV